MQSLRCSSLSFFHYFVNYWPGTKMYIGCLDRLNAHACSLTYYVVKQGNRKQPWGMHLQKWGHVGCLLSFQLIPTKLWKSYLDGIFVIIFKGLFICSHLQCIIALGGYVVLWRALPFPPKGHLMHISASKEQTTCTLHRCEGTLLKTMANLCMC